MFVALYRGGRGVERLYPALNQVDQILLWKCPPVQLRGGKGLEARTRMSSRSSLHLLHVCMCVYTYMHVCMDHMEVCLHAGMHGSISMYACMLVCICTPYP